MKVILLYSTLLFLFFFNLRAQTHRPDKPNIIMIVADDLGYGDLGCYGSSIIPTPNIDRLAKEGIRFRQGYVTAPICAPSRYGILSGAYQQRFGVLTNRDGWASVSEKKVILPKSQKTINETLKAAGYVTGLVGKWNLEHYPKTTFDESMSVMHFGGDYWPDATGHYLGVDEPKAKSGSTNVIWGPQRKGDEYLVDRFGRQSVEFINKHKNTPFFLYLAFNAPHSPMQAKLSLKEKVSGIKTEANRLYAAMTISMDENIGKVLNALDSLGLRENTIIAFVSDNGPTYAYNVGWPKEWPKELLGSAGPLSGYKGQLLEGGIRVPYIISWPKSLPQDIIYDRPVSTLDFYPTFCDLAGAKIGKDVKIDGVSLLPYIKGKLEKSEPHRELFWYMGDKGALRKGDWKLHVTGNSVKLYNLKDDLAEKIDLSRKYPEIVNKLSESYKKNCSEMAPAVNP